MTFNPNDPAFPQLKAKYHPGAQCWAHQQEGGLTKLEHTIIECMKAIRMRAGENLSSEDAAQLALKDGHALMKAMRQHENHSGHT